ncbi:MAG: hypothetical protein ACRC0L_12150 [Angustibacter sp.]
MIGSVAFGIAIFMVLAVVAVSANSLGYADTGAWSAVRAAQAQGFGVTAGSAESFVISLLGLVAGLMIASAAAALRPGGLDQTVEMQVEEWVQWLNSISLLCASLSTVLALTQLASGRGAGLLLSAVALLTAAVAAGTSRRPPVFNEELAIWTAAMRATLVENQWRVMEVKFPQVVARYHEGGTWTVFIKCVTYYCLLVASNGVFLLLLRLFGSERDDSGAALGETIVRLALFFSFPWVVFGGLVVVAAACHISGRRVSLVVCVAASAVMLVAPGALIEWSALRSALELIIVIMMLLVGIVLACFMVALGAKGRGPGAGLWLLMAGVFESRRREAQAQIDLLTPGLQTAADS